jgi:hypothetical protein
MPRRLGKPLPPVKEVAAPTQSEIDLMIANWDAYAPAKYRGLLAARPVGTKGARWFWDSARRRYISAKSGHVVTPKELRAAYLAYHKAKDSFNGRA